MSVTIESDVHFTLGRCGQRNLQDGVAPIKEAAAPGSIPHISRLMALALRFERLVREGKVRDYAKLARLGRVTRARLSQIMNLLNLAPDIQEEILFLPRTVFGRDPINEHAVRLVAAAIEWRQQRSLWNRLLINAN